MTILNSHIREALSLLEQIQKDTKPYHRIPLVHVFICVA